MGEDLMQMATFEYDNDAGKLIFCLKHQKIQIPVVIMMGDSIEAFDDLGFFDELNAHKNP